MIDSSQAVTEIATNIRKMAHVPIQVWQGWDPNSLFGGCFSALGGFKTLIGVVSLNLGSVSDVTLPGPPGTAVGQDHYGGPTERKMASHVMMLWKYKPLNQDDALYP
jgi:hypothetical protein